MNAIDKMVVIGVFSGNRTAEYDLYGRSLVEEVLPEATRRLRLIGGRRETMLMGSPLAGVVSF